MSEKESPLAEIRAALEQIVADLDSAEEWAKRTNVGHIHARVAQARMEARSALSLLGEMERRAGRVWWCASQNIAQPSSRFVTECFCRTGNTGCGWRLLLPLPPENGGSAAREGG